MGIPGVPKINDNYNPATWMLEVTSSSVEEQLGVNFTHIYKESSLCRDNKETVEQLSIPPPNSKDLHFATLFAQNSWGQFKACLWKQYLTYWRSPSYNLTRIIFVTLSSVLFAALFWKQGKRLDTQQDLFNILGAMFLTTVLTGINNSTSVLPFARIERNVLYRERFAGMYSTLAYLFAQVFIEIPYVLLQVVLCMAITYPTIGYYWSAYKLFWFFYTIFCTLLCFIYLGMLLVSLTPNTQVALIMSSSCNSCNTMLILFSGFVIPRPQIPKWWIWASYISPLSWTLNGQFTSRYGDLNKETTVFGETKTIASFLEDCFGFYHYQLGLVAVVLIVYPLLLAYCLRKLNFQHR